jgi:hypothetical protein
MIRNPDGILRRLYGDGQFLDMIYVRPRDQAIKEGSTAIVQGAGPACDKGKAEEEGTNSVRLMNSWVM